MIHPPVKPKAPQEVPSQRPVAVRGAPAQNDRLLRRVSWLLIVLAVSAAGVLAAVMLIIGWQWRDQGRILPGIQAVGVPLDGLTTAEAVAALETSWAARRIFLISDGNGMLEASPTELGLELDAAATAAQAAGWTQRNNVIETTEFILDGGEILPVWRLNLGQSQRHLQQIAPNFYVAPVDAGVVFEDGQLQETPPLAGEALDIQATLAKLEARQGRILREARLPLVVSAVDPQVTSTAELIAATNSKLDTDLTLFLFDPISGQFSELLLPSADWATWLTVTGEPDSLRWTLSEAAMRPALQQLTGSLPPGQFLADDRLRTTVTARVQAHLNGTPYTQPALRLYHQPTQHIVQAGDTFSSIGRAYGFPYPWIQQVNPGVESLSIGQVLTIPSPDDMLPLPVVENKRIIIDLSDQRLWAYEEGGLKWDWPISTGIESSPTSPGVFQVQSHQEEAYASNWDLYMPNFMGIYQPVPSSDFMNGFHGFPTRDGQQLLWTNSLGTQVTYGCVLVGDGMITDLYQWAEPGTIVEIRS